LHWVLTTLSANESQSSPVIIVVDAIDKFAQSSRQTLLYSLFDRVQATGGVPLSVIGMSTRLDFVSLLEKRVRSRFSHRSLIIPALDHEVLHLAAAEWVEHDPITLSSEWKYVIRLIFTISGTLSDIQAILLPAVCALPDASCCDLSLALMAKGLATWKSTFSPTCHHLHFLHLAILAAAHCLVQHRNVSSYTFEQLYDVYVVRVKPTKLIPLFKRAVAFRAFSDLVENGFFALSSGGDKRGIAPTGLLREFVQVSLNVPVSVITSCLISHPASLPQLSKWI
jgi:hypothetical protein